MNKGKKLIRSIQREKTYKGEFYTLNSIMGNDWAWCKILLGGWEAGKSYAVMNWAIRRKLRLGEAFKLYWLRLTESATDNMLANNAEGVIDPDIVRNNNIKLRRHGQSIYNLVDGCEMLLMTIVACSTFFKDKGKAYYDKDYTGEYCLVLDEMNRESSEANRFSIVYAFARQIENLLRSQHKSKINVIMIGNTTDEAGELLSAFNFIPERFGRFYLRRKGVVIDYIKPNEKYKERRKLAIANKIIGDTNAATTNEMELNREVLVSNKLCGRPIYIIKFSRGHGDWFTVHENNVVKLWNKEQIHSRIPMRQYIATDNYDVYDIEAKAYVVETFNVNAYKFTRLSDYLRFVKNLKLIKK